MGRIQVGVVIATLTELPSAAAPSGVELPAGGASRQQQGDRCGRRADPHEKTSRSWLS